MFDVSFRAFDHGVLRHDAVGNPTVASVEAAIGSLFHNGIICGAPLIVRQ